MKTKWEKVKGSEALDIKKINIVRITDNTEYDPRFCGNGGKYSFWRTYRREENGQFACRYATSADMTFCPHCGCFCDENHSAECAPRAYSEKEVFADAAEALNHKNYFVEIGEYVDCDEKMFVICKHQESFPKPRCTLRGAREVFPEPGLTAGGFEECLGEFTTLAEAEAELEKFDSEVNVEQYRVDVEAYVLYESPREGFNPRLLKVAPLKREGSKPQRHYTRR